MALVAPHGLLLQTTNDTIQQGEAWHSFCMSLKTLTHILYYKDPPSQKFLSLKHTANFLLKLVSLQKTHTTKRTHTKTRKNLLNLSTETQQNHSTKTSTAIKTKFQKRLCLKRSLKRSRSALPTIVGNNNLTFLLPFVTL